MNYDELLDGQVRQVEEFLKSLSEDDRVDAAIRICVEATIWAGRTKPEMVGILEYAKHDLIDVAEEVAVAEAAG